MKQRFPEDMDFDISAGHDRCRNEGIKEIVETLVIAIVLVILVVYLFLQGWRATLIPLLAVPVSLIGTFVLFRCSASPSIRFLCSGWSWRSVWWWMTRSSWWRPWSATSRKDCRPKRGVEGDGGDLGPGDRHRAGSVRGVRAHGFHSRHHRPALPAVRGDHRDFGDPLGVQCALAEPGAGGAPACGHRKRAKGCCADFLAGSTASSSAQPTATSVCPACCFARALVAVGAAGRASPWLAGSSRSRVPTAFFRTRTRATVYLNVQLPNAASLERTEEVVDRVEKISVNTPGVRNSPASSASAS